MRVPRKATAHALSWLLLACLAWVPAEAAERYAAQLREATAAVPDATHGEQIYATCAGCHGADAGGSADGLAPALAGQHRSVLLKQLVDYRGARRRDLRMEQVAASHRLEAPQAMADVAGFLAQLPAAARGGGQGDEGLIPLGARLYAGRCAACHGAMGEGSERDAVPRLQGQQYAYLLRQMHDATEGRRTGFTSSHMRLLEVLQRDDLIGLAEHLSRLLPSP